MTKIRASEVPIRLQPAELAKFATALAVAKFMNGYGFKLTTVKNFSITLFLIFLPMVCILLQKETGSALVYLAFFLMLYREGMTGYILLILGAKNIVAINNTITHA